MTRTTPPGSTPSTTTARAWPTHAQHLAHWAEASALARERSAAQGLDVPYGDGPNETLDVFPAARARRAGAGVHPRRLLARARQERLFVRRAVVRRRRRDGGGAQLRAVPGGDDRAHRLADGACAGLDLAPRGGAWRRPARASSWPGIRPAATWRRCCWAAAGSRWPTTCRRSWSAGALAISGLYDLEPMRRTPSCRPTCSSRRRRCARLSPAFFPRPKAGKLYAVVGADESEEFLRQNQLIRDQWGPTAVPVCETVPRQEPLHRAGKPGRPGGPRCTTWRCACWACADHVHG